MYLKMFAINLVLVVIYLLFFNYYALNTNASPQDECYHSNLKTGETWKMVWHDEFESDNLTNWKIDHSDELSDKCPIIYSSQVHCNRQENAWTTNGLLVMMAKQEKYTNQNFTTAMITTEQYFDYGRYEIRAMAPMGEYIWVGLYTKNDNEAFWPESGQINIMTVKQLDESKAQYNPRGFYPSGKNRGSITEENTRLERNDNSLHLYGVEWNDESVKFFFDDKYGETFFWNDTTRVKQWKQLRIKIDVIQYADSATKLNWKCPAFVIDYVRVYEKVQLDDVKFNAKDIKSKQCTDKSESQFQEQDIAAKKICTEASIGKRFKSLVKEEKIQTGNWFKHNYWVYTTIILLIIIIVLVVYLFVFVPRKVEKAIYETNMNQQRNEDEYETREYLEIVA